MKCFKKSVHDAKVKFLTRNLSSLVQKIKPVVKFMTKKHKTNAVTPSTCNYDVVEAVENERNDVTDFHPEVKFQWGDEAAENRANELSESMENERNEEIEKAFLEAGKGEPQIRPSKGCHLLGGREAGLPAKRFPGRDHFWAGYVGRSAWAPSPDADVRRRGDAFVTECQSANGQTPLGAF